MIKFAICKPSYSFVPVQSLLRIQITVHCKSLVGNQDTMAVYDIDESLLPSEAKGLVFDLDGTVLDTMKHHWAAWEQAAKEHGVHMTVQKLLSLAGKPSREIIHILLTEQELHGQVDPHKVISRKTELYVDMAHETEPIDIILECAKEGKKRGLPIAIATGGSRVQVDKALTACGLMGFFDACVTADDVEHGKPHPEVFLKAAAQIGVEPQFCVGYEDAQLGMEAIRAAGFLKAIDVTKIEGYPVLE